MKATYKNSAGNALFLILIAVALFAALSYAVTQSGRGGASIGKEQAVIDGALINECQALVESGIMRLKFTSNCQVDQISYELPDGSNANPDAPANKSCNLFAPEGAGLSACGAYKDAVIPTAGITQGDTTTVGLTAAGTYFGCNYFSDEDCYLSVKSDSLNWNEACIKDGAGTTSATDFLNAMCSAACGGALDDYSQDNGNGTDIFVQADTSTRPVSGSCQKGIHAFACTCWE